MLKTGLPRLDPKDQARDRFGERGGDAVKGSGGGKPASWYQLSLLPPPPASSGW